MEKRFKRHLMAFIHKRKERQFHRASKNATATEQYAETAAPGNLCTIYHVFLYNSRLGVGAQAA